MTASPGCAGTQVLRADEQLDRRTGSETAERLRRNRHAGAARGDQRRCSVDPFEAAAKHRDLADEGGDEAIGRAAVEPARAYRSGRCGPPDITAMRSDSDNASLWSWVTNIVVTPSRRWISLTSTCIEARRFLSSAENGSSSSRTFGSDHQGARQRHALLLAARQLPRLAALEPGKLHQGEDVGRPAGRSPPWATPRVFSP